MTMGKIRCEACKTEEWDVFAIKPADRSGIYAVLLVCKNCGHSRTIKHADEVRLVVV